MQLVDCRSSNGTSSFWRGKGSPYRYSSDKRFPSIGTWVPVHRTKVTDLGEMGNPSIGPGLPSFGIRGPSFVRVGMCTMEQGSRHSDTGYRRNFGPPAIGEGLPIRRKWGPTVPPGRGTTVPRKMGTPPSEEGYPFLGNGLHVSRKMDSVAVPRRRGSPPAQSGSRPRVGVTGPGNRDSRPSEMGYSSIGNEGTRPSGKG